MNRRYVQRWVSIWLVQNAVGAAILTSGLLHQDWLGMVVGTAILMLTAGVVHSLLDGQGVRLANIDYRDDDKIPNELGQALRNADTSFIKEALRSHDPGHLIVALEKASALIDTLKSLAKVLLP